LPQAHLPAEEEVAAVIPPLRSPSAPGPRRSRKSD